MLQVTHELLHINLSIIIIADNNIEYNYTLILYTNIANSAILYSLINGLPQ